MLSILFFCGALKIALEVYGLVGSDESYHWYQKS